MAIDLKNIFHFFSAYPRATFGGSAVANVELLFLVYEAEKLSGKFHIFPENFGKFPRYFSGKIWKIFHIQLFFNYLLHD
jgi:hypothetical protein